MADTINGRTPEEIKRGLDICIGNSDLSEDYCEKCPYIPDASCRDTLEIDALAYIRQLEHSWDELFETAKQLERERDAAVEQLKEVDKEDLFRCSHCIHDELCNDGLTPCVDCDKECPCHTCRNSSNWEWRGVQEVE